MDQTTASHTGGIGRSTQITTGSGLNSEDGLAHPGLRANSPGQLGITSGGVHPISTNRSSDDGFHPAGIGKIKLSGIGRNTMETVPGRSPVYIHHVGGTGLSTQIGSR
jgi:hypothetical protein